MVCWLTPPASWHPEHPAVFCREFPVAVALTTFVHTTFCGPPTGPPAGVSFTTNTSSRCVVAGSPCVESVPSVLPQFDVKTIHNPFGDTVAIGSYQKPTAGGAALSAETSLW